MVPLETGVVKMSAFFPFIFDCSLQMKCRFSKFFFQYISLNRGSQVTVEILYSKGYESSKPSTFWWGGSAECSYALTHFLVMRNIDYGGRKPDP